MRVITVILLLSGLLFSIQFEKPLVQERNPGEEIDLGTIGPGQTVTLEINPLVERGGIYSTGGRYDIAWTADLPEGWKSTESKLYGDPLQIAISADPNAAEGDYTATIVIGDEADAERLGNASFPVRVRIVQDIMDSEVTPSRLVTGPGQPARYLITVTNKGTASDVFEISAEGVERWKFKRFVFLSPQSAKTIYYEIAEQEEEAYRPVINVVSTSSSLIRETHTVGFEVRSTLFGDYAAMNNGILLFPIFESGIYALAGLLSNVLPAY